MRSCSLVCALVLLGCGQDEPREASTGGGASGLTGAVSVSAGGTGTDSGPASTSADSDSPPSFDVGDSGSAGGTNTGGDCTDPDDGTDVDFSYIWIANSPEGTVSKIDTRTLAEQGRYLVGGGTASGDPSRTSVNLEGDVAVVDRGGGLLKIVADVESCPDGNNNGVVDTSTGVGNVLPWGQDECVAWRIELPDAARPVAWTAPEQLGPCVSGEAMIWASAPDPSGAATVYYVHGNDGAIEFTIDVPAADCNCPDMGVYGGAVDAENNFWSFVREGPGGHGTGDLYVFRLDQTWQKWAPPAGHKSYGIAVDRDGRVWLAGDGSSVAYFDPATETFTQVDAGLPADNYVLRGLMPDGDGHLWIAALNGWNGTAGPPGMLRVNTADVTDVQFIDDTVLTGLEKPAGTSIDVDGFVWLVDTDGEQAFRYDPATGDIEVVTGLIEPYTYSDMTGFGLRNVAVPPAG